MLFVLVILLAGIGYTFGYLVQPGFVGIRKIGFGPGQGFHERALKPGYHWGVPFFGYSEVFSVPTTLQVLHFHRDFERYPKSFGPLDIATDKDRNKVILDASAFVRFMSGAGTREFEPCAGGAKTEIQVLGAAELLKGLGRNKEDWFRRIQNSVGDELRRSLGKLSGTDFYNPSLREQRVCEAKLAMNASLARFGIQVEDVLLRRYTYEAESIDEAIFQKNLQDQERRLNETRGELAEVQAELQKSEADWTARIKTLQTQGDGTVSVIRSQGDLYEERKRAEADLLVAKANAESERLRADALAQGQGAAHFVAKELAGLLSALQGGMLSGINPYDLDAWVEQLRGSEQKSSPERAPTRNVQEVQP